MAKTDTAGGEHLASIRETVESIWIAIVLAFVLRAFVLEAFMIPTGSMAPRLMGKHGQFDCPACGYHYSIGVDRGKDRDVNSRLSFQGARCPSCRYPLGAKDTREAVDWPFGGDRVLVAKVLYRFRRPDPWDVVVFKNPLNNEENYIKRLIGRPGEQIEIVHGDVFVRWLDGDLNGDRAIDRADFDQAAPEWQILRKPPGTQEVMWQIVFDNDYQPDPEVYNSSRRTWRPLWQPTGPWEKQHGGRAFRFTGSGEPAELRFRGHRDRFYPCYAYNELQQARYNEAADVNYDLKLSLTFIPDSAEAEVGLRISSLRDHFRGWISAAGEARLEHGKADKDGRVSFWEPWGAPVLLPPLEPGRGYRVALTHVDREVTLWLDGQAVITSNPALYPAKKEDVVQLVRGVLSENGELPTPTVAIQAKGGASVLWHVKLMRDVYYTYAQQVDEGDHHNGEPGHGVQGNPMTLRRFLDRPDMDEFFVLGDNSPASKDSRMWGYHAPTLRDPYAEGTVPRYNLMGKAFFVYWPGGYRPQVLRQLPVVPNVGRMRLIR